MAKPSKEVLISEMIEEIQAGKARGYVLGKLGQKWEISRTTFDRYWKTANDQYADLQEKAKQEANKTYIETAGELAKEVMMSEAEAKKNLTDIARGNLADYMVINRVERKKRIEVSLQEAIDMLQENIIFEDEFSQIANYNAEELQFHMAAQAARRREVLRYQLELNKNPFGTVIIDGPVEWVEVAELDMVKVVRDKAQGKIKSFKHTEHGVHVEMYSADAANVNILKMYGSFEKDNAQKTVAIPQMTDSQFSELLKAAREASTNTGK